MRKIDYRIKIFHPRIIPFKEFRVMWGSIKNDDFTKRGHRAYIDNNNTLFVNNPLVQDDILCCIPKVSYWDVYIDYETVTLNRSNIKYSKIKPKFND